MNTTTLRNAYYPLLTEAAHPDLGAPRDAGWDADHILAHILSVDAGVAAVALAVASGSRPTFDNRMSLDPWNLQRIISEHAGRAELIRHVRAQAAVLCDIAEQLSDDATSVLVPSLLLSNGTVLVDQPVPLAGPHRRARRRPPAQARAATPRAPRHRRQRLRTERLARLDAEWLTEDP